MKAWNEAKLVELDLNQTAGGSREITKHDGKIDWNPDPSDPDNREKDYPVEEYAWVSGISHIDPR